jgi:hypothetical protein
MIERTVIDENHFATQAFGKAAVNTPSRTAATWLPRYKRQLRIESL